jgi:hypothetical protein
MFVPHNYFDRDPSRESAQGVRLKMERGKKGNNVTYYGPRYDTGIHIRKVRSNTLVMESAHSPQEDIEPDLSRYDPPEGGIGALSMP